MKAINLSVLLMLFFSCSKEEIVNEVKCKSCYTITESNQKEASEKCKGRANNYPRYVVESETFEGELCGIAMTTFLNMPITGQDLTYCAGVVGSRRKRKECR